jgi:hypothetical protein
MCRSVEQEAIALIKRRRIKFIRIVITVILFLKCIPFFSLIYQSARGIKSAKGGLHSQPNTYYTKTL